MYRLIFCDLDGTVADFDGEIDSATQRAMKAVAASGAYITLSTGRGYQLLKPYLDRVTVNAPLVCCNGGLIVEAFTRKIHYVSPLPLPLAHDLVRLSQREGLAMWFYLHDMDTMLEKRVGEDSYALRRDGAIIRPVIDPLAELASAPHKVVVEASSESMTDMVLERMRRFLGERARPVSSQPRRIDVIVPGLSKAGAMSWVADYLGIPREETIGIGDGDNDVEMLRWAGLGIAMGNASQAAREAASWIAPCIDNHGLAIALERFVLNR